MKYPPKQTINGWLTPKPLKLETKALATFARNPYSVKKNACSFVPSSLAALVSPRIPVFGVFGPLLPDYSGYPPPPSI